MQLAEFFDIFDYSNPELGGVAAAAADGDYESAKRELLRYFVRRKKRSAAYSEPIGDEDKNAALAYISRHGILTGPNEADVYLSSIFLSKSSDMASLDVMPFIRRHLSFMIMSRQKEDAAAFFFSPRSIFPPYIEVEDKNGTVTKVHPSKYAYVSTKEPDFPLADEGIYEICEESASPEEAFGANTGRVYLEFDFSEMRREEIVSARFVAKITISESITKKELLLFNIADSSWDNSLTWSKIRGNVYSWESSATGPGWDAVEGSDCEYLNVICRFGFARAMAQQYLSDVEHNAIYGEKLLFLMDSFSKKKEGGFNRVLETGERLSNFTAVLGALIDTPAMTGDLLVSILWMMYRDMKHLAENPDLGWSNWAVVRTSGLSKAVDFLPEFKEHDAWRNAVRETMDMLFERMYSADFSFREAGYAYSFWCMELFITAVKCAEMNSDPYSAFMRGRLEKALDASIDLIYPNFYDTNIGDSDYRTRRPYLKKAAKLMPTKKLLAFLQGKSLSRSASSCYPNANLAVLRSDYGDENNFHLTVQATPFDGHAHADLGSVTFYAYDRPLVTDSGRYGYSDNEISRLLKTPHAHNSIEIENAKPANHSAAGGRITVFASNKMFDFVKLSVCPYEDLDAVQQRSVFLSKADGVVIVSDFVTCGQSARKFNQNWHFMPYSRAKADYDGRVETHFEKGANLKLIPASADVVDIRESIFSAGYGVETKAKCAVFTKYGQTAAFVTMLLPMRAGEERFASAADLTDEAKTYSAAKFALDGRNDIFYTKNSDEAKPHMFDYDGEGLYVSGDKIYMAAGKRLAINGVECVESEKMIKDMFLHISGGIVEIESSSLKLTTNRDEAVKIFAPKTTHVIFNGESVPFTLYSDCVYAVGC
ncbi:MAG: heparinase II/III family protein [Clostridia bacterium]|nr:heparinase II/III family protein [Clostridia bacterium]